MKIIISNHFEKVHRLFSERRKRSFSRGLRTSCLYAKKKRISRNLLIPEMKRKVWSIELSRKLLGRKLMCSRFKIDTGSNPYVIPSYVKRFFYSKMITCNRNSSISPYRKMPIALT